MDRRGVARPKLERMPRDNRAPWHLRERIGQACHAFSTFRAFDLCMPPPRIASLLAPAVQLARLATETKCHTDQGAAEQSRTRRFGHILSDPHGQAALLRARTTERG